MDIIFVLTVFAIVMLDQKTKDKYYKILKARGFHPLKKNFITLRIARNEGAALGLLQKRKKLLISLTIILMGVVAYYFIGSIRSHSIFIVKLSLAFILGGGIGNLMDRLKRKFVIDFFSFNFKRSPIFNLADIFIFIGVITLQFSIIFLL